MTDTDHQAKMERLKASVDRRIEAAQDEKGLLVVHTGAGKGKTTAALGMAIRCLGHGMKVAIVQFIKGAIDTAEERILVPRTIRKDVFANSAGVNKSRVEENS